MSLPPIGSHLPFPNSDDMAILKYVGSVEGHEGVFCGLELCGKLSKNGKNNGSVNGKFYFNVDKEGSGIFVPLRKVMKWISDIPMDTDYNIYDSNSNSNGNSNNVSTATTPKTPNTVINKNNTNQNFMDGNDNDNDIDIENNELRRRILYLENELSLRDQGLKDLGIQLDELDSTLKEDGARLSRKEERFSRYKAEKEEEIKMLMSTIETLEKKIDSGVGSLGKQNDRTEELENEIRILKDEFTNFKVKKNKEIDNLRKVEMENYTLSLEIEKLKNASCDAIALEQLQAENEQMLKTINDLKLDLKLRDSKIEDLETMQNEATGSNKMFDQSFQVAENVELPVFKPSREIDASAGRPNFCTYCDATGHETEECPYQKHSHDIY